MIHKFFPAGSGVRRFVKLARLPLASLSIAALLALSPSAQAVPYASGVTNNAGTVSFVLNESADNVTVVFDGGASSSSLGALGSGTHSFLLGAAMSFRIEVTKSSGAGYLGGVSNRISSDANVLTWFFAPRSVAVNRNPGSPNFGRVYVANSVAGTTTVPGGRATTDGIYLLNANLTDAVGQGNTARTGGIAVAPTGQNGNSPWKMEVGEDDTLYIADWSTNQGTIWMADPDVTLTTSLFQSQGEFGSPTIHTTISSSPIPQGSLAAGNLTIWAIDGRWPGAGNRNRLLRWTIDAGPVPWNTAPTALGSAGNSGTSDVYSDVDRGPDGKLYVLQNRSAGTDTDSLRVFDTDGITLLWGSLARTGSPDMLRIIRAVKVSPDGKVIALNRDDGRTWIIGLTNGIPDMASTNLVDTFVSGTSTGRDVAFDAAGNLYVVNNSQERLRVFSPGGTTMATTRSDGTFSIVRPPPLSVVSTDSVAFEAGSDTAAFSIYRTGDTTAALTVRYMLTGNALNGTDYATNVLSAIIPAGETNIVVMITPVDDDESEFTESVSLTLVATTDYDLSTPTSARADIVDNDAMVLTVIGERTNLLESFPLPFKFTIHRTGDTNFDAFVTYEFTGAAQRGDDFTGLPEQLFLQPGVVTLTNEVPIIDDRIHEGDEVFTFTLTPSGYTVGTPGSVTCLIRDNEFAPACVLFADDFETDTTANWVTQFGANNGISDSAAAWSFDYSVRGIPPAPHSLGGSTRGLYMQVNKSEATVAGSAALNLYPTGQSFRGNYALRADMLLNVGTAGTTEHSLLGLNHSGNLTNRVSQSTGGIPTTAGGDGVWTGIATDGSNFRDYTAYTYPTPTSLPTIVASRTAASLTGAISAPPYAFAGSPGNGPTSGKTWAELELRQMNDVVSLFVNQNLILTYTNTSGFTNGNIMLGMNDQFDSIGSADNYVVFDNVSVVGLDFFIKTIQLLPASQVQIDFVSPLGGLAGDFRLQSGSDPAALADDNSAVITATAGGFRAVTTRSGSMTFYKIRR